MQPACTGFSWVIRGEAVAQFNSKLLNCESNAIALARRQLDETFNITTVTLDCAV